ncbi:MAG: ABC transporter substrate-binding protein [Anaerolineae bacterium]
MPDPIPRSTRPILKVGLVAPFEGLLRWEGYRVLYAVKLALREANAQGGVGGHSVELVALNDRDEPDLAARCAQEMVLDEDVVVVVGHYSERSTLSALPFYLDGGMVLVAPSANWPGARSSGRAFSLAPDAQILAEEAVALMDKGNYPAGVEFEEADWPSAWGGEVRARVAGRWVEARVGEVPRWKVMGTADALEALEDLALASEVDADAMLRYWIGPDVCHLTMAKLLGGGTPPVFCQALGNVDGESRRWLDFAEKYRAYSGMMPTVRTGLAYDATWAVLRGLEVALHQEGEEKGIRQRVAEAMAGVRFDGVTGPVAFDPMGHRVGATGQVWQVAPEMLCVTCAAPRPAGVGGP